MNFESRKARLSEMVSEPLIKFPMLLGRKMKNRHLQRIKSSVNCFVYSSLVSCFDKDFILCEDLLHKYEQDIERLPNITPNGLILPKHENYLAYHEVHKAVAEAISEFYGFMDKIHIPVNIRLVKGNSEGVNRPKASSKLHTDIWAGEFSNSIMIFMPLFGDIKNINVEFFEPPLEIFPDYIRYLSDYDDGAHFKEKSTFYDCELENDNIYFIDSFLLHRTVRKRTGGWRLSIDFRFLPWRSVETDVPIKTSRYENYIPVQQWREIGTDKILYSTNKMGEYNESHSDGYADLYHLKML